MEAGLHPVHPGTDTDTARNRSPQTQHRWRRSDPPHTTSGILNLTPTPSTNTIRHKPARLRTMVAQPPGARLSLSPSLSVCSVNSSASHTSGLLSRKNTVWTVCDHNQADVHESVWKCKRRNKNKNNLICCACLSITRVHLETAACVHVRSHVRSHPACTSHTQSCCWRRNT